MPAQVGDEPVIEIDQTYELAQLPCSGRTSDSINLGSEGTDTLGADVMAKELQTLQPQKALGLVYEIPYSLSRWNTSPRYSFCSSAEELAMSTSST